MGDWSNMTLTPPLALPDPAWDPLGPLWDPLGTPWETPNPGLGTPWDPKMTPTRGLEVPDPGFGVFCLEPQGEFRHSGTPKNVKICKLQKYNRQNRQNRHFGGLGP